MLERFKTVYQPSEIEIIEKKSRFIGQAFPVENEEAALGHLAAVRRAHVRAGHNCFAWQIGLNDQFARQSDDGEPAGTAGMPILDLLRKEGIKNTMVVVTRYFGGVLLGTGGLVRAYGRAAKEAVTLAPVIEKILYQKFSIKCPYHLSGKLQYEILQAGHVLHDQIYAGDVEFIVFAEHKSADRLAARITDISASQARVSLIEHTYCAEVNRKFITF